MIPLAAVQQSDLICHGEFTGVAMGDVKKNFERWRRKVPEDTAVLLDQVLEKVIPDFKAQGFSWYGDYAGGKFSEIGPNTVPLQRRTTEEWPTVEFHFDQGGEPRFSVYFGVIQPVNYRLDGKVYHRDHAIVCYAPAYFLLKKNDKPGSGIFGLTHGWYYDSNKKIESEIAECRKLLPIVFELFDNGIPDGWLTSNFGKVAPHIWLMGSWYINEQRRIARGFKLEEQNSKG